MTHLTKTLRPPSQIKHLQIKKILFIFLILLIVVVGYWTVYRAAWNSIERTDYTVYLAAGQAVLSGTNIYEVQNSSGWNYVYPPPFALLLTFFAVLPKALGALIWYVLSMCCIACGSYMSVQLCTQFIAPNDKNNNKHYLLYALPLLSTSVVLVGGTLRCQASEFMIPLIIGTFYFHFNDKPFYAAISLATAILIKVFPASLLAYFLIRKQWKMLAYTFLSLCVLGLLMPSLFWGVQKNIDYIVNWFNVVAGPVLHANADRASMTPLYAQLLDALKPRNQSLEALLLSMNVPSIYSKYALVSITVIMLSVMWFASRHIDSMRGEMLLCSAFVLWHLIIPPIAENHYFGVLIMPLTVLLGLALFNPLHSKLKRTRYTFALIAIVATSMVMMEFTETALLRPLCVLSLLLWGVLIHHIKAEKTCVIPHLN